MAYRDRGGADVSGEAGLPAGATSITPQQMAMLVKFIVEVHGKKPLPEGDTTASVS